MKNFIFFLFILIFKVSVVAQNYNPNRLIVNFNSNYSIELEKIYLSDFGSQNVLNKIKKDINIENAVEVKPLLNFLHRKNIYDNVSFLQIYREHIKQSAIRNHESLDIQNRLDNLNPSIIRSYIIVFKPGSDINKIYKNISKNNLVENVYFDYYMKINSLPNDTYVDPDQNGTWSNGSFNNPFEDLWGAKIVEADRVWNNGFYGEGAIVAVVDTGIDYNHPDIAQNLWINTGEIPDNNIDDDNNGYTDDYMGFNFDSNSSDILDHHGHGTHVSGTIAAPINGIGIVGIAPKAKIMSCPFLGASGTGGGSSAINAFYYAIDNGAKVISNSWGATVPIVDFPGMNDVAAYAEARGAVIVFAAGNSNIDISQFFPANIPTVITVGSLNPDLTKSSFSNYGNGVEVFAPGSNILSLRANNTDMYGDGSHTVGQNYIWANGTSMACPHVSGVVALMQSAFQNNPESIRNNLNNSAIDIGEIGHDDVFGNGLLNSYRAVFFNETSDIYLQSYVYNANILSIPITVRDGNLHENSLTISVSNERNNLNISLNRQQNDLPFFSGFINVSRNIEQNALQIQHGDTISINYLDSDFMGQPMLITKNINIDGEAPMFTNIVVHEVDNGVIIDLDVNENSTTQLLIDGHIVNSFGLSKHHRIYGSVSNIVNNHNFNIIATDIVGNQSEYDGNFINKTPVYWVSQDGSGDFEDLQTAVNNVPEFSIIKVTGGTYQNNITTYQTPMINLSKTLKIIGSFNSVNGEQNSISCRTIIDGINNSNIGIYCHNIRYVPVFTCELSGLKISNFGGVTNGDSYNVVDGSVIIDNVDFINIDNLTISNGVNWGGIKIYDSKSNISNCQIINNNSVWDGAGLSSTSSELNISDCLFTGNNCRYGSGIASYNSNLSVVRTRFSGNISTSPIEPRASVGIHILEYKAKYQDCIFDHNIGNGVLDINGDYFDIVVDNCTFFGNTKATDNYLNAGSIVFDTNFCNLYNSCVPLKLYNSILWNEDQTIEINHDAFITNVEEMLDIRNCIIKNNSLYGVNIITSDPEFINSGESMFELSPSSPAIDAGFIFEQRSFDFDKSRRIIGSEIDIGAQEYDGVILGDVNCDGRFDNFDIDPFILLLTDINLYRQQFECELNGDIDRNGRVDNFDIDPFVDLITR